MTTKIFQQQKFSIYNNSIFNKPTTQFHMLFDISLHLAIFMSMELGGSFLCPLQAYRPSNLPNYVIRKLQDATRRIQKLINRATRV